MIVRLVVLATALIAATEAAALTCAPPDPFRAFRSAQESPDRYIVLHGRLTFDPARMPQGGYLPPQDGREMLQPPTVPAWFEGQALSPDGFTTPFSGPMTLHPTCVGPWCPGGMAPGTWLLFARQTATGYEVEIGACGGWAFDRAPEDVLEGLAACLRGEACGPF